MENGYDFINKLELIGKQVGNDAGIFHFGPIVFLEWFFDEKWSLKYVSKNINRFGYNDKQLTQSCFSLKRLIYSQDLEEVENTFYKNINEKNHFFELEYRITSIAGVIKWIHNFICSVYDEEGRISHFSSYFIDITSQKEIENQFAMTRKVLENTLEGVLITDVNGIIQWVNPAFTTITGYSSNEAIGMHSNMLNSRKQDDMFYEDMWKIINRLGQWKGNVWNKTKKGHVYPQWLTISAIKDKVNKVTHYSYVFSDLSDLFKKEEHIKYQTYHDILTGLPNRFLFKEKLNFTIEDTKKEMIAIIFLDLDRFKVINDTLGHSAGDELLKEVAKRLGKCITLEDDICRFGEDEFTFIIRSKKKYEDVTSLCKTILKKIQSPFVLRSQEVFISASMGISLYPSDGKEVDTLIRNADIALNRAKEEGRNNYQFYTPSMNNQSFVRLFMESNLRRALERNEFLVYYQPKISLRTGEIIGAEALVRWQHPELGLVYPGDFIPLAEETGLIEILGEWVFRTACMQNKMWQDMGVQPLCISVNLSLRQLQQKNFIYIIKKILEETNLDARYIELEITESAAMKNAELTIAILSELNKMGIRLSIDDFGTGYSSLSVLKKFPIHTIKIDRSFIKDITQDDDNKAIVAAIISMSHTLKLNVIAEGVETNQEMNYLKEKNCDEIQGYFISPPVPMDSFENLFLTK